MATRVAGCGHACVAARVAGCGHARCPTMCTAVLMHKSEKHSFLVIDYNRYNRDHRNTTRYYDNKRDYKD